MKVKKTQVTMPSVEGIPCTLFMFEMMRALCSAHPAPIPMQIHSKSGMPMKARPGSTRRSVKRISIIPRASNW